MYSYKTLSIYDNYYPILFIYKLSLMVKTSSLSLSPLNFYNLFDCGMAKWWRQRTLTPLSWVRIPVLQPIFSFKIPFSLAQWWYIGSIPIACLTLRSGKVKPRTLRFSRSNLRTWWVCVSWYNNSSISSLWQRWANQLYLVWWRSASLPPPYGMVV